MNASHSLDKSDLQNILLSIAPPWAPSSIHHRNLGSSLIHLLCIQKPRCDLSSVFLTYTLFFYPEISNEDCRHIYIHPTHQLKASQDNTEDKITNFFFTMMSCLCVRALALIIVMREGPFCAVQNWPYDLWSSSKRHVKYVAYCFYWQGKPAYLLLL